MRTYRVLTLARRVAWFVLALHVLPPLWAQNVPAAINYQGKLYDPSANNGAGGPITGVQQVEFRIYDDPAKGTLIWGRSFPVNCTADGVFNVLLSDGGTWLDGATNSLTDAFQGSDRFLELTVAQKGGPIAPRQQMVSAPYALSAAHAAEAATAGNGFTVRAGDTVLQGNTRLGGTLAVLNSVTLSNTVTVAGLATLKSGLTVAAGGAAITGDVNVTGKLTVGSTANGGWVPVGGIIMWSGSPTDVPPGWALCDGSANTPDLRDRFVIGAGTKHAKGTSGGSETKTLSADQMPAHSHTVNTHNVGYAASWNDHNEAVAASSQSRNNGDSSFGTTTVGSGSPFDIMPPYFTLAFIMRTQ